GAAGFSIVHGKSAWHGLTCVYRIVRVGWGDLGWLEIENRDAEKVGRVLKRSSPKRSPLSPRSIDVVIGLTWFSGRINGPNINPIKRGEQKGKGRTANVVMELNLLNSKNGERGDGEDKEGRNICRFPLPSVAPGLHLLSDSVPDGGLRRLQPASSTARPSRAGRGESRGGALTGPAAGWGVSSGSRRGGGARPDRGRAGRQPAGGGGVCLPSWAGMWWWSLPIPASSSASQETVSDGE
ncbi:hypothetical protein BHE74_00039819, partial [Ensete ventricosum]